MFYNKTSQQICENLRVTPAQGLSAQEAKSRLEKNGPNALVEKKGKSMLSMFLAQLNEPMVYILFAAALISILMDHASDSIIILIVVLVNAVIGMIQESKAEKALEALKNLSSPTALVRRGGALLDIPASELVEGDIVILEAGRVIPADLRLTTSINLKIEESALTGESVPVDKDCEFVAEGETGIGDRINMAFSTTSVTYGRGEGIVVATGMNTEIGKIAIMLSETVTEMTPLQKRLADLGKLLGIAAVLICLGLFGVAVLQNRDIGEMFMTAISLAVAAIPEGLPAVVTIVLALGVQRMVKVNTIVRRLPSVETLGAVSIVCSDKTGTLTQNKMTVKKYYFNEKTNDASELDVDKDRLFLHGFVLCNDASVKGEQRIGDPTELALIDMGIAVGMEREALELESPRINEQAFDSVRKMMTTVHAFNDNVVSYTKGAIDSILPRCKKIIINGQIRAISDDDVTTINKAASEMSSDALRVLALGMKTGDESASEHDLTFVGLVGMIDPPRPEAKDAVRTFKDAQIRTVMITGDHKDTALAIAKELGIAENESQCMTGEELNKTTQEQLNKKVNNIRVFARVSPEHKVMIVKAFKSHGYIVSMTGDGVNDAPSLKTADIGVAMGITGTDVSKGASDMILTDDNFATIEKAVEEGRNIYNNIKKSVFFLLSSNFGEIIAMVTAIVAGLASPLKPIQILWVNLVTDSLPGLALGVDKKSRDIMKDAPRNPGESLFAKGGLLLTILSGMLIGGITLFAFLYSPISHLLSEEMAITFDSIKTKLEDPNIYIHAQTYAFATLSMSQLFHAIGMRNMKKSIFLMNHLENKVMLMAFAVGMILQVTVVSVPFLSSIFGTIPLNINEWLNLVLLAATPILFHEIYVLCSRFSKK